MIENWIKEYEPINEEEIISALREIMQEITLAALSRTDFFEKSAFYGGTALRIFHGLERYSEDLDFSLIKPDQSFSITPYLSFIVNEFESLGIKVSINHKINNSSIDSAFLKTGTLWEEIILKDIISINHIPRSNKTLKIKLEVDRNPPVNFETEAKLLIRPFSFYVNCFSLPSLFAGKLHAILFRKWKNRVKGRDWYDLEWYIKRGVSLDLNHFLTRAKDSGHWENESISKEQILILLNDKIDSLSFDSVKDDVIRFIDNINSIKIWSNQYFKDLVEQIKFSSKTAHSE